MGMLFVRGPIYLDWLTPALQLPGRIGNVVLLLAFLYGLNHREGEKSKPFRVESSKLPAFGLNRGTLYRGLDSLGS